MSIYIVDELKIMNTLNIEKKKIAIEISEFNMSVKLYKIMCKVTQIY